jgi:hypothetical protein
MLCEYFAKLIDGDRWIVRTHGVWRMRLTLTFLRVQANGRLASRQKRSFPLPAIEPQQKRHQRASRQNQHRSIRRQNA